MITWLRRWWHQRRNHEEGLRQQRMQAICKGTMPCPYCRDTGPHTDEGIGENLGFRCRHCRCRFKMSTYNWAWAWNQPLSERPLP